MTKLTPEIVEKLIVQNGRCFYCGFPMPLETKNLDLLISRDHVMPKSKGGQDKKNIVLCHAVCNLNKGDADPTKKQIIAFNEFKQKLRKSRSEMHEFFRQYRLKKG